MDKTKFMKKIIIVLVLLISNQVLIGQDLDKKTLAKIKVKLITAENSYKKGNYTITLTKIKEIEGVVGKNTYEDIQNLKVKALIGRRDFESAGIELEKLYGMDPSDEIITDIANYEDKINSGIKAEIKKRFLAEMAEKRRKENERIAALQKKKEKEKLDKILKEFKYKTCPECRGEGKLVEYIKVKSCNYYNSYPGIGYWYCQGRGRILHLGRYYTCKNCKGKGTTGGNYKTYTCSECDGDKKILYYAGYPKISSYDERKHIREHKYTIQRNIRAVENKKAEEERKRKQRIVEKKDELKRTLKTRTLTDRIYFDTDRKETLSKYSAKFYRIPQKKVDGLFHLKDYSIKTNKLIFEGYSSSVADLVSANLRGIAIWYYSSSSKNTSSSYDGRLQSKFFYDDFGYKNMTMNFYANYQDKVKLEFFSNSKSIFKTSHGVIDAVSYQKHSNGFPKYIKWSYIGSKKKYNKYYIFNIDEKGNLKSRLVCNKKWKVKETVTY